MSPQRPGPGPGDSRHSKPHHKRQVRRRLTHLNLISQGVLGVTLTEQRISSVAYLISGLACFCQFRNSSGASNKITTPALMTSSTVTPAPIALAALREGKAAV